MHTSCALSNLLNIIIIFLLLQDWTALATVSGRDPIVGYPFANIFSVSDGPVSKSTGIPYMYLTDMEISMQDLKVSICNIIN